MFSHTSFALIILITIGEIFQLREQITAAHRIVIDMELQCQQLTQRIAELERVQS